MWCTTMVQSERKTETISTLNANAIYLKKSKIVREAQPIYFKVNVFVTSTYFKQLFHNWLSLSSCTWFCLNHQGTNFVRVMYFHRKYVFNYPKSRRKMVVCVLVASDRLLISQPFFFYFERSAWICQLRKGGIVRIWPQFSRFCIFHKD